MVLEPRLSIARNKLILLKREVNVKDTETSLTPRTRDDTESWNVRSSLFLSNSVASFTPDSFSRLVHVSWTLSHPSLLSHIIHGYWPNSTLDHWWLKPPSRSLGSNPKEKSDRLKWISLVQSTLQRVRGVLSPAVHSAWLEQESSRWTIKLGMIRHYFANKGLYSQSYGFFRSHVWMWVGP